MGKNFHGESLVVEWKLYDENALNGRSQGKDHISIFSKFNNSNQQKHKDDTGLGGKLTRVATGRSSVY